MSMSDFSRKVGKNDTVKPNYVFIYFGCLFGDHHKVVISNFEASNTVAYIGKPTHICNKKNKELPVVF